MNITGIATNNAINAIAMSIPECSDGSAFLSWFFAIYMRRNTAQRTDVVASTITVAAIQR